MNLLIEKKPMESEISFLLGIILDTKTLIEVRRKCKERIGEVEASLTQPIPQRIAPPMLTKTSQAPSTLAAIGRQTNDAPITAPLAIAAARNVTIATQPVINTGEGTRGPKKF